MTVIVKHNKTNSITDWTQAQLDEQIALGNFPSGTTLANIVLPSDWNNDHTLTGVGTMAEQDATAVAITGGTINNTTIGATTATTGRFTSVTTPSVTATVGDLNLTPIGGGNLYLNQSQTGAFGTIVARDVGQASLGSRLFFDSSLGASSIRNNGGNNLSFSTSAIMGTTSGVVQQSVSHTASAVNYVQVTGAATGAAPTISAQGSDGAVDLTLNTKSTGIMRLQTGGISVFRLRPAASAVNFFDIYQSATTKAPYLQSTGSDANVPFAILTTGTGAIDLAAGSSGVNISNGGTVTAITVTNNGATAYTSHPTPAITAPTTAGGVQAVATSNMYFNSAIATTSIVNGGTGYTVGNTLIVVGGTSTATAQFTVTAVSSGVVTAINSTSGGTYSVIPTGTLSVTGGSGTGFTFTINGWAVRSLNITNAGSGYIEQPTITFSGGGGSGAAAYANIGSSTIFRGLAATSQFHLPSGEAFRLSESGGTSVANVNITNGSSSQNTVYLTAYGSATNPNLYLASKGTGNIIFATNTNNTATGTQQAQISHTASAVNYVQVTGSATGAAASSLGGLSFTGSDASPNFAIGTKGTGYIAFYGGAATNVQAFRINTTSAANTGNLLQVQGAAAGSAPSISAIAGTSGTDTNIDIKFTPLGTGVVQFGTYTAGVLTPTGYVTIKDSGGTSRRLLVG
jgi:hypothetical protein